MIGIGAEVNGQLTEIILFLDFSVALVAERILGNKVVKKSRLFLLVDEPDDLKRAIPGLLKLRAIAIHGSLGRDRRRITFSRYVMMFRSQFREVLAIRFTKAGDGHGDDPSVFLFQSDIVLLEFDELRPYGILICYIGPLSYREHFLPRSLSIYPSA
jgi:hypothetical protein